MEEKGADADALHKYRASKVLAERAAWTYVADNKDSITFDLVTVLPPVVYGPVIHDISSPDALNSSLKVFCANASLPEKDLSDPVLSSGYWADVRDLAAIHAALPDSGDVARGLPRTGKDFKAPGRIITTKVQKIFAHKFRSVDDMAPTTVRALKEKGCWAPVQYAPQV